MDTTIRRIPVAVVLLALLMLLISACIQGDRREAAYGEQFRLNYDQVMILEDGNKITFLELVREARCPEDALCTWDGEAEIAVALERVDESGTVVSLTIPGFTDRYSTEKHVPETVWGYRLTLLQLDPYPQIDRSEGRRRYVATLMVEKNDTAR
jgi:hypothetical protein